MTIGEVQLIKLLRYVVQDYNIVPLIAAGMASSFSLMKKNQKIKPEKSFHPQGKTPWPAFSGRPLPAFDFVFM
jgi:hypothetical protein